MNADAQVSYVLDDAEMEFDYRVDGDSSVILLRNKAEMNVLVGVTDLVTVSPVSEPASIASFFAGLIFACVLTALYVIGHCIVACVICGCGSRIDECHRRRSAARLAAARALAMRAMAARPMSVTTLKNLSLIAALSRMKRPVKRNIATLELPHELKEELVQLRRFPLSVACGHSRRL